MTQLPGRRGFSGRDMPKQSAQRHHSVEPIARSEAAQRLLELLYRVHYVVGMKVQDTLRTDDRLDRHQIAVLWIIRSEGVDGRSIPRKYVEKQLTSWYDISSSAISKAIRALASTDINLLNIVIVNTNHAFLKVVEARQQFHDRALATAALANDADEFA